MHKILRIASRAILCALSWAVIGLASPSVRAQGFPLIVDSSTLRQAGIAVGFGDQLPPLENKCYVYGEGGYLISTSDAFYDRFKRRGFSLQAMCLGLVSETHYDPETGRRLPTYIRINRALIREDLRQSGKIETPGAVSDELPLDLPDCFKNANPYTDCEFRFGRITGRALTAAQTDAYKRLGATIDQLMTVKIQGVTTQERIAGDDPDDVLIRGFRLTDEMFMDADNLPAYSSATHWVRSASLLRGYGYMLDAVGGAGPDVNPDALKAVTEQGLGKTQTDAEHLRQIVNSGR
jgi:hypothetical protein